MYPDGTTQPIEYASRTLNSAERNYSQLEKEAVALIFGIKRFHFYVYGRTFRLVTNHKPLQVIFDPKEGVPSVAASRLQRWTLILSGYQYELVYKMSKDNAEPDCFSRLPLPTEDNEEQCDDIDLFFGLWFDTLPATCRYIAKQTMKDSVHTKVAQFTPAGSPRTV